MIEWPAMPHLECREGDTVMVRATVLTAASGAFQVRIEDNHTMACTVWVPTSEVAKPEHVGQLKPRRRLNLDTSPEALRTVPLHANELG